MNKILYFLAALCMLSFFASCDKPSGEKTECETKPYATGSIVFADGETVNLDMVKVFNDGLSWSCYFYDSSKHVIPDNYFSSSEWETKVGAKALLIISFDMDDGFNPTVKGSLPTVDNVGMMFDVVSNPVSGGLAWWLQPDFDQDYTKCEIDVTETAIKLNIVSDSRMVNYDTYDYSDGGVVSVSFEGTYEVIDYKSFGIYTDDYAECHPIEYCGIQLLYEEEEMDVYAVLLTPDVKDWKAGEMPERFVAIQYNYPKEGAEYTSVSSGIKSYRMGDEVVFNPIHGYYPMSRMGMDNLTINLRAYSENPDGSESIPLDAHYYGAANEMSLSLELLETYFGWYPSGSDIW